MKLSHLRIVNFRSCRDVSLSLGDLHALVGANNAGKSTVLRALDFLFNPSSRDLTDESFWNGDPSLEIRVEASFCDLAEWEEDTLKSYLMPDGTFLMARTAKAETESSGTADDGEIGGLKIVIGQQYKKPVPEPEWLQDSKINGNTISEWWRNKGSLKIGDKRFLEGVTSKPGVGVWKESALEFIESNQDQIPMTEQWVDNPQGYANVLKGTLPFFVLVPAVRDVNDESKGTKSSPFGKLLYAILESVSAEKREKIQGILNEVSKQMNRSGGSERVSLITETEADLNNLLGDLFTGCDLEIEFQTPTLEVLLTSPKLYINDGFRNVVENKGHGLQRAVIFTILRRYAQQMTAESNGRGRNLIIAVEEPELYMHPQAQRTIRTTLRRISQGSDQVFFSTHSALLVDVTYFDEIIRMESVEAALEGGQSKETVAWQLPMSSLIQDIEVRIPKLKGKVTELSLRDLYSNAYNPRRNEGFFANKVVLVEGPTEEYSLPVYAEAIDNCSLDPKGVSVIECGGKGPIDRLYRIFNELHIPCFLLFDYDMESEDTETVKKSKELLELVGLPSDPPDELLVSDRLACFPTTWEADLKEEIPNFDELMSQASRDLGGKVGKPLKARYVARKLTAQEPPFVPPSIESIIRMAVESCWQGSCLTRGHEAQ